ncbi:MAG: hypothetical protein WCE52_08060 [Candidatus Acidiferrum sp.]
MRYEVVSQPPTIRGLSYTSSERFILERHNPLEKSEYIRFVVGRKDEESHVEQGIFQAAAQALEWQNITGSDADDGRASESILEVSVQLTVFSLREPPPLQSG